MRSRVWYFALFLFLLAGFVPGLAKAWWPGSPTVNVPVSTIGWQDSPAVVADGSGGAWVTWNNLAGTFYRVDAQHFDGSGKPLYAAGGSVIAYSNSFHVVNPWALSDGAGGLIATYEDFFHGSNNGDIDAQRVRANGTIAWATPYGAQVISDTYNNFNGSAVEDGASGVYSFYHDSRNGNWDLWAAHLGSSGSRTWGPTVICNATGDQLYPISARDNFGGVWVTWMDSRAGNRDIYIQQVSSTGAITLAANGLGVCTLTSDQWNPRIVPDGTGGVFVAWYDWRNGNGDIYAQHYTGGGTALWATNGIPICTASTDQTQVRLVSDGTGGAILAWTDQRNGTTDLYAQRVNYWGTTQWTADGVPVCTAPGDVSPPVLAADGANGTFIAWSDGRYGGYDIYAQRLSGSGSAYWTANGIAVCSAPVNQDAPAICNLGNGAMFLAWADSRNAVSYGIYAQRVDQFGQLGAEPRITSVKDVPNDQGGLVKVSWAPSLLDSFPNTSVTTYYLFRSVPPNLAASARSSGVTLGEGDEPSAYPGHRVFRTTGTAANAIAWEYVSSVTANRLPAYSALVPTASDSLGGSNPRTKFMVEARNSSGSQWWFSDPDSGYSVDNLSPGTPSPLTANYATGTTRLHWNPNVEADLAGYRVYRGTSAAFVPGPTNWVASPADTGYADAMAGGWWYKVTAVDAHGNESVAAVTQPTGTLGVYPDAGSPLALSAPAPNPLRERTTFELSLPRPMHASLAVYDQQGRRVRVLANGTLPAGPQLVTWDGANANGARVASGVYYAKLVTSEGERVRRVAVIW